MSNADASENLDFYAFAGEIPGLIDPPEALDFADMAVSTARPVAPAVETDKVQARLAQEVVSAAIRHDYHADRGLLPR